MIGKMENVQTCVIKSYAKGHNKQYGKGKIDQDRLLNHHRQFFKQEMVGFIFESLSLMQKCNSISANLNTTLKFSS